MQRCATSDPLVIKKGETFSDVLRWATSPKLYATITGITKAAPAVVTAPLHGIPDGWPIERITSVAGMKEINTHKLVAEAWEATPRGEQFPDGIKSRLVDANSIALDEINASGFSAYGSGGVLEFWTPVNLSGYTAKMQIRPSPASSTILLELSTALGSILIDNTKRTVTRSIDVATVNAITWSEGVCTLEMTGPTGIVTLLEVNRPVVVCETDVTRP